MNPNKKISDSQNEKSTSTRLFDQKFEQRYIDIKTSNNFVTIPSKNKPLPPGTKIKLMPVKLGEFIKEASKNVMGYVDFNTVKMNLKLDDLKEIIDPSFKQKKVTKGKEEETLVYIVENGLGSNPLQGTRENGTKEGENQLKEKSAKDEDLSDPRHSRKDKGTWTKNSYGSHKTRGFKSSNSKDSRRENSRQSSLLSNSSESSNLSTSQSSGNLTDDDRSLSTESEAEIQTSNICKCCKKLDRNCKCFKPLKSYPLTCQCLECKMLSEEIKLRNARKNSIKQCTKLWSLLQNVCPPVKQPQNKVYCSCCTNFQTGLIKTHKLFERENHPNVTFTVDGRGVNYQINTHSITDENKFCCQRRPSKKNLRKCPCCLKVPTCYKCKEMSTYQTEQNHDLLRTKTIK